MKININNFGPVKKFEFDLSNDLTVIYGENNNGKSYTMSLVYLIIKRIFTLSRNYSRFYYELYKFYDNPSIKNKLANKFEDTNEGVDFIDEINSIVLCLLNNTLANEIEGSIKNTFGDLNQFNSSKFEVSSIGYTNKIYSEKPLGKVKLNFKIENGKIIFKNFDIGVRNIVFKSSIFDKSTNFRQKVIFFYIKEFSDNIFKDVEFIVDLLFKLLLEGLIYEFNSHIYFIPASRSGIYFILKDLTMIQLEYAQKVTQNIGVPRLSEPHSDFFQDLTSISNITKQKTYLSIAQLIEKEIINGSIEVNTSTRTIYYKDNSGKINLNLDKTSSMVAEISLIAAFFKYVVNNANVGYPKQTKPIIFIEEPEAHLHPSKQVKFAEILGEIVKTDSVRIVISSHSNYIFNKLNNMIMAKELDFKKYSAYVLKKGKKSGSTAKLLKTDELGSDDENFSDVSDKLYSERMSIIDKINKKNGKK